MKYICLILGLWCSSVLGQNTDTSNHYKIGTEANYPPFEFKDGEGRFIGFEIDLLKAVGEKEGFSTEFFYHPREDFQAALDSGKADIFASTLGISAKRRAVADMSDPYLDYRMVVYILDNKANAGIQSLADLKNKIFSGNVSSKSTLDAAIALSGSADNYLAEKTFFLGLRNVWAGKADAIVNNDRIFQYYGGKKKYAKYKYRLLYLDDTSHDIGLAVRKGRSDLLSKINDGLKKVKADGTFDRLMKKWFDSEES